MDCYYYGTYRIGYRLNDRFWDKKIATKTVKSLVDYLFNDIEINLSNIFLVMTLIYKKISKLHLRVKEKRFLRLSASKIRDVICDL